MERESEVPAFGFCLPDFASGPQAEESQSWGQGEGWGWGAEVSSGSSQNSPSEERGLRSLTTEPGTVAVRLDRGSEAKKSSLE